MKFAMIPINRRYNENDERVVRRILISYKTVSNNIYQNCKVIEKDDYFKNPNSSHQYKFTNKGFKLISDSYGFDISQFVPYQYDAGRLIEKAIEFEADTIEEAIKQFNNREEVH